MRIILIGSGNVASVLGGKLHAAGHSIMQVYSRNTGHAAALAGRLDAEPVADISSLLKNAEIYIISISDDELYNFNLSGLTNTGIVVHTAGSVGIDVLKNVAGGYGVFYPLQTLRKEIETIHDIPLLIDGSDQEVKQILLELARSVSGHVQVADDDTRRKLHLAAVVVNNFSNHLYFLTEAYCRTEGVSFNMLAPLITEGAARLAKFLPAQLQTGPAIRHDLTTIHRHQEMLEEYPELLELYDLFTKDIMKRS